VPRELPSILVEKELILHHVGSCKKHEARNYFLSFALGPITTKELI
jgi:hypothetical protein